MKKSQILKTLLDSKETLVMPDAYDPISARIIECLGFKAVQCSGYSFSIAACKKEEIDISLNDNLSITSKIVDSVSIPVMADGEDGFGGAGQIPETIKKFIETGVAGINLEDQVLDQASKEKVIESSLMVEKIKIARNTARENNDPDLIINGRTDALNTSDSRQDGLKEAIKRGNLYLEAGADITFVTGVKTFEEAKILVREINGPLSITAGLGYNIKNFTINDLKEIGVARVSLPTIAIASVIKSLMLSIDSLKTGNFDYLLNNGFLCTNDDINKLINK